MGHVLLDLASLEALRTYAEEHPFSKRDMIDIMINAIPPPGDTPAFTRIMPPAHLVVFSIEEHPEGFFRHASVSVMRKGKVPQIPECELIIKSLGFLRPISDCLVYWEEEFAINIIEPYIKANDEG